MNVDAGGVLRQTETYDYSVVFFFFTPIDEI